MVIKLDLYRIFISVSKHKSFSKAAHDLFLTQPAVSQSINQLETELDTLLFNRSPKGVTLTEEGKILHDYINNALSLIDSGEQKLEELKNLSAGTLAIGVSDTISRYFLLPLLEVFHEKHPNIKFKLANGTTEELCTTLKNGELDLIICNLPIEESQLNIIPCKTIQDTFVYGSKFNHQFEQEVSLEDLLDYPLICLDQESTSRHFIQRYIEEQGFKLIPEFEIGSHELLLDLAKINLGVACVTKEFSLEYLERDILREVTLTEPIPKRSIGIGYAKNMALSSVASTFMTILMEANSL